MKKRKSWLAKRGKSTYGQVTTYLEQLICSYKRLGHAGKALKDCSLLFEKKTPMWQAIRQAKQILLTGGELSAAFSAIESRFDSRRMRLIHRWICNEEQMGAGRDWPAELLLENLERWKDRTMRVKGKKRRVNWLDARGSRTKSKEERRKKMYLVLCGEVRRASWFARYMAKKNLSKYVREEFPYWFLLTALYLRSMEYHEALRYSAEETDGVFRIELERLIGRVHDSPRSLEPYVSFFSCLSLPEVQSGMRALYAVCTNGYGESETKYDFLAAYGSRLLDPDERGRRDAAMAGTSAMRMAAQWGFGFLSLLFLIWSGPVSFAQHVMYTDAKEFHGEVVRRLENSYFDEGIIEECRREATGEGYDLDIRIYENGNEKAAKVTLAFQYRIPLTGMKNKYEIEGYSR